MNSIQSLIKLLNIDKGEFKDENDVVAFSIEKIVGDAETDDDDFQLTPNIIGDVLKLLDKIDKIYGDLDLYVDFALESDICAFSLRYDSSPFYL